MTLHDILDFIHVHSILAMIGVFLLIVGTTYWPGRKSKVERAGMIPLDDDR